MRVFVLKALVMAGENLLRPFMGQPPHAPLGGRFFNLKYGPCMRQNLDVIQPGQSGPWPVLVWFHGGGFLAGDKAYYRGLGQALAGQGYLVMNMNYRLAPQHRFPAQLEDAARAVRWAVDHASDFGGDPGKIFLAGDSAGAFLAAWYGTALTGQGPLGFENPVELAPREIIRGLILFYGLYDFKSLMDGRFPLAGLLARALLGRDFKMQSELVDLTSPLHHLTADLPPCLVSAGEKDRLFFQSRDLVNALAECQASCRSLLFSREEHPEAGHAFMNFHRKACTGVAFRQMLDFMRGLQS